MLELDIAYQCTKFDHYSFSRSRDMVDAHQNLNGSRDLNIPLSGMICHVWASTTINLSTKFSLSISTHYKDMKSNTKYRFGVVMGNSKSLKIAPFNRARTSSH